MSKTMKNLLNVLSAKFDIIICDTSPILVVSDAHHLSNLFDGTILVAKARRTKDEMARKSLKLIKSVGGKVLGMVINAQGENDESYGYYHREYYGLSEQDEDKGFGIGKTLTRRKRSS
jgi:Mrp family chromosome partitioning ATPase